MNPEFINKIMDIGDIPKKKFKRTSKVNQILRTLYDTLNPGQAAQFDPKKADVSPVSLRQQLRSAVKSGHYSVGTRIIVRGKEWYFERGK